MWQTYPPSHGCNFELNDEMVAEDEDREALQDIVNNAKLSEGYMTLARDIEVMEAKTPEDIYKVENLKKEQAEAMSKQKSEMEVEIMAIKHGIIDIMAELKGSNGKDKTRSIIALESLVNKVDSNHACGRSNTSTDEYEAVCMETDDWAIPSMPQGKPNK